MPDIAAWVEIFGLAWVLGVGAQFFVVFAETAGNARPLAEGEKKGHGGFFGLILAILRLATPALLIALPFLVLKTASPQERLMPVVFLVLAVVGGMLVGTLVGKASSGLARLLHAATPVFAIAAFAVTLYATWPHLLETFAALRDGRATFNSS